MTTNLENAEALAKRIKTEITLPGGVAAYVSTLGGPERPSVCITFAFDPRDTWVNNILENSKYAKVLVHFNADGTGKFSAAGSWQVTTIRQTKVKNIDDAFAKLAKWVSAQTTV